jgi:hypothetical protein
MGLCISPKMGTKGDDSKSCMAYFIDDDKIEEEKAKATRIVKAIRISIIKIKVSEVIPNSIK